MWVPKIFYERMPQFWLLLGLLFILSGILLGLEYNLSYLYLALGFGCIAKSGTVITDRSKHRVEKKLMETQMLKITQKVGPSNRPAQDAPADVPDVNLDVEDTAVRPRLVVSDDETVNDEPDEDPEAQTG